MDDLLLCVKSVVDKFEREKRKSYSEGKSFNVFELCGVDHYELMHSKIIAEFLSPSGKHGFGDAFLKLFFARFGCADSFTKNTVVRREVSSAIEGGAIGRFDILLEDKDTSSVCVIENKIYANEQSEQLSRYWRWLEQCQYKNRKLIFLTPDGRDGTTLLQETPYIRMSYVERNDGTPSVVSWMELCHKMANDKNRQTVAVPVQQYIKHVNELLIGGWYMNNKVCEEMSERLYEAQLIYENYAMACTKRVRQLIDEIVKKIDRAKILNDGLDFSHMERGVNVSIQQDGGEAVTVFVGFEGTGFSGFFVGVQADVLYGEVRQLTDDELEKWKERSRTKCFESNKWWPIYCYVDFNELAIADGVDTTIWNGAFFSWLDSDGSRAEKICEKVVSKIKDMGGIVTEVMAGKRESLSC